MAGCGFTRSDHQSPSLPVLVFGRTGYGSREFSYPRAIAIAPDQRVYVVDKTGRIQVFDPLGEWQRSWRTPEIEAGKPTGLGIGPDGNVFVADTHYARVLIYSPVGQLLRSLGSYGEACGQFHLPTDVGVARDGCFYVGEYGGNDRISRMSAAGDCLGVFGQTDLSQAPLARPQGIYVANDGSLWIADARNHRICHADRDGRSLGCFGEMGSDRGQLRFPYNVEMLSDGSLVVVEYGNNRVQRFSTAGRSLGTWGRAGRRPGELAYPWALAVDHKDRVWIVDSGNNRIQVINGLAPSTWSR